MKADTDRAAGRFFGLLFALSVPFYGLGITKAALPFAPALPISALMAIVPMIAALLLVHRHGGAAATGRLFRSAFDIQGIQSIWWVIFALATMPVAFALTAGLLWLSGAALPAPHLFPVGTILASFAIFFIGAVSEELGWQGYAYPRLTRRYSPLQTALIIGVVWALWHLIPFVLMGHNADWILWHSLTMVLMRIIIVWLVVNTGQSILIAALFHMMSNSVWGVLEFFDPYYDPLLMCAVLLAPMTAGILFWRPFPREQRRRAFFLFAIVLIGAVVSIFVRAGLPMRDLQLSNSALIGAVDEFAIDMARPDLFSGTAQRVVPFQILYPATAPGTHTGYMPDAGLQIDAMVENHGWIFGILLGQIGSLAAPWTDLAMPASGREFPVVIYLPGVTGYMQMGSFQTTALAANGYVVVTLNQPGAVAAALFPDGRIVKGLTREDAVSLIAPSYRIVDLPLPVEFSAGLAPETSIVPYLAADVGLVLDRLAQIDSDPAHILHGLLDLDRVGVMGMSLGAIVTAQACAAEARIGACLMMDAPVPTDVAATGLRQPALWISRPPSDQRLERAASGGWPDDEIKAQADTISKALSNSENGQLVHLAGLFHVDFTDLPAIQPTLGWLGQSGGAGVIVAHMQINALTIEFFDTAFGVVVK